MLYFFIGFFCFGIVIYFTFTDDKVDNYIKKNQALQEELEIYKNSNEKLAESFDKNGVKPINHNVITRLIYIMKFLVIVSALVALIFLVEAERSKSKAREWEQKYYELLSQTEANEKHTFERVYVAGKL